MCHVMRWHDSSWHDSQCALSELNGVLPAEFAAGDTLMWLPLVVAGVWRGSEWVSRCPWRDCENLKVGNPAISSLAFIPSCNSRRFKLRSLEAGLWGHDFFVPSHAIFMQCVLVGSTFQNQSKKFFPFWNVYATLVKSSCTSPLFISEGSWVSHILRFFQ